MRLIKLNLSVSEENTRSHLEVDIYVVLFPETHVSESVKSEDILH